MNLRHNLPTLTRTSLTLSSLMLAGTLLTACDSENNSAEVARAVELEKLRANGTIIEKFDIINGQTRLRKGEKHQLVAMGVDNNGNEIDVTDKLISWASSDPSIATVNSKGVVTAVENSDVNQGIVIITATTINDIPGNGEISVSDEAVTEITLIPLDDINTCINANIKGDVTYNDGYISYNTAKGMEFTVHGETETAVILKDGNTLYTSAEDREEITITSNIGEITSAQLIVTADPKNLDNIDILNGDQKITDTIELTLGNHIQVNAQANLINAVSYNINPSIKWAGGSGLTAKGENKGKILAHKKGRTTLVGTCGGKEVSVKLEVEGDANFENVEVSNGTSAIIDDTITIQPLDEIKLTLTANYDSAPTTINVSEFSDWQIESGYDDIAKVTPMSSGTDKAHIILKSLKDEEKSFKLTVTYDENDSEETRKVITINIEK